MTEVPADGGPPLGHGASLGTDAFPPKGILKFPEGIDLEMIDSLAPANNTQLATGEGPALVLGKGGVREIKIMPQ